MAVIHARAAALGAVCAALLLSAACGGGTSSSPREDPVRRTPHRLPSVTERPLARPMAWVPEGDPAADPPPDCANMDEAVMWRAIPVEQRAGLDDSPRETTDVDLDGAAPPEIALVVNQVRAYDAGECRSLLWVLRCRDGVWSVVGRREWSISPAWEGFYDDDPGIQVLRAETVPGVQHPFLRVEMLDQQGGADPRYSRRELQLLHLTDAGLITAFACLTNDEAVSGPERAVTHERLRVVSYRRGRRPTIRVQVTGASDGGSRRRIASADYTFNGQEFHAARNVCAE